MRRRRVQGQPGVTARLPTLLVVPGATVDARRDAQGPGASAVLGVRGVYGGARGVHPDCDPVGRVPGVDRNRRLALLATGARVIGRGHVAPPTGERLWPATSTTLVIPGVPDIARDGGLTTNPIATAAIAAPMIGPVGASPDDRLPRQRMDGVSQLTALSAIGSMTSWESVAVHRHAVSLGSKPSDLHTDQDADMVEVALPPAGRDVDDPGGRLVAHFREVGIILDVAAVLKVQTGRPGSSRAAPLAYLRDTCGQRQWP